MARALRVYPLPCQGVRREQGGGTISCISPLSPKQHVFLSGLVSLAQRRCCPAKPHNGILKVPCGQLWPLSISPGTPVSGCWLIRQTGGWVIVPHPPNSHTAWPTYCFVGVLTKTGLLKKGNPNPFFCVSNLVNESMSQLFEFATRKFLFFELQICCRMTYLMYVVCSFVYTDAATQIEGRMKAERVPVSSKTDQRYCCSSQHSCSLIRKGFGAGAASLSVQ